MRIKAFEVQLFMQMRNLGRSNIQVVPLMFGGNVFGWTIDEAKSFEILDAFTDRGFNFIDTADVYSIWAPGHHGGESETIIGNWFKRTGKRDKIVLATKVGMDLGGAKKGLGRARIVQAVEDSLKRLQTDYIDLYQSHKDDPETPLDETLLAYEQLIAQGKVRIIGASNYNGARLTEALDISAKQGLPVYQTLQPEYNLYLRQDYESDLEPVAKKHSLGVIPYFSLASGFLTGKYKSKADVAGTEREKQLGRYFDDRGDKILVALHEVAEMTGAKAATIALAWLLARPGITAPIASATSVEQLAALFAAVDLKLDSAALDKLNSASSY